MNEIIQDTFNLFFDKRLTGTRYMSKPSKVIGDHVIR